MKKIKRIAPLILLAAVIALLAILPFTASGAAKDRQDTVTGITLKDTDGDGYLEVGTADEMKALGNLIRTSNNGISIELTADIDLNPGYLFSLDEEDALIVTKDGETVTDLGALYAWPYTRLYGNVEGNGFTVRGLYQDLTEGYGGLFGYGSNSGDYTIRNLHIKNAYVKNTSEYAALLLGQSYNKGMVEDCTVEGIVVGTNYVGGITGYFSGTIKDCTATVTLIGDSRVGGIAASNGGIIEGCIVNGSVQGNGERTGGIVGSANEAIIDSINRATVTATGNQVGGIAGYVLETYIDGCVNEGAVSGVEYVGGIAGEIDNNADTEGALRSRNAGDILATGGYVGGVVGKSYYGSVLYCSNEGRITGGASNTGGVVGNLVGTEMGYCYNNGLIVGGAKYTGGVIGYMYSGDVFYLYNTGEVRGVNQVGGIVGGTLGASATRSVLSLGLVTGSGNYVGAVIGENNNSILAGYYLDTVCSTGCGSDDDADGVIEAVSAERLASGEVAYLLQYAALEEDGAVWGQRLTGESKETLPVFGTDIVYRGFNGCDPYYSNTLPAVTQAAHEYDENGFCAVVLASGEACDSYEPPVLVNGVYQIKNAGNLYWFAAMISGGYDGTPSDTAAKAVLTDDITVNPSVVVDGVLNTAANLRPWAPIGNDNFPYIGHFDGDGHTISGLYCDVEGENGYVGLFGNVRSGGLVENVTVADSYFSTYQYVGALTAVLHTATLRNCHARENVIVIGSEYIGGLVGRANGYTTHSTVTDCSFAGTAIINDANIQNALGGIVGMASYCDIVRCVNTGTLHDRGANLLGGIVGSTRYGDPITMNCLNAGTLYTSEASAGGIAGMAEGNMQSCLSVGRFVYTDEDGNNLAHALVAQVSTSKPLSYSNLYYDASLLREFIYGIGFEADTRSLGRPTAAFATGEIAYLLGEAWGQTLGKDTYPSLGGDTVYAVYGVHCDGTSAEYCSYSNDPTAVGTTGLHKENEHGYCTLCEVNISYASISAGRDLTVHYYVSVWDEDILYRIEDLSMRFTMNGRVVTVPVDLLKMSGEEYVFSFGGIAPQCMSDSIAAELYLGDAVVASLATYSVKQNMEMLIALYADATDEKSDALVRLATDLLTYGAAAQIYKGYHTDSLADADLTTTPSQLLPTAEDSVKRLENVVEAPSVTFTGATVWFDHVNKIAVKLSDAEGVTVVVKRNGEIVEHTVNGTTVYTDGIYATDFAAVYTFELYRDGNHLQTFTYSVASYVYAMMNKTVSADSEEISAMAELARALYRYGVSASEYLAAVNAEK